MKKTFKIALLLTLICLFILSATTVYGSYLKTATIQKHVNWRGASTIGADGNILYKVANNGTSDLYYELAYIHNYAMEIPGTIRWGNENSNYKLIDFRLSQTVIGNSLCYKQIIRTNKRVSGTHCLWSDTVAKVVLQTDFITALYGGSDERDIIAISVKDNRK